MVPTLLLVEEIPMFTIGKLAQRAQLSAESIRFYETEGLIHPARKTDAGYRLYTEEAVRRLAFIRQAQRCGFTLAEIRELLAMRRDGEACCDDVYRLSVEKKLQLEGRIRALTEMSRALSSLIEQCAHDRSSLEECPILGALERGLAEEGAPK